MSSPSENLARSLVALKELQKKGSVGIKSKDLTRTNKDRLVKNGFIKKVLKGWYIPSDPTEKTGSTTSWYINYWSFCASYLNNRFKDKWVLSPEQSIALHVGNMNVPKQLLVRANKGNNNITQLLHNMSILETSSKVTNVDRSDINGVGVYSLANALVHVSKTFYKTNKIEMMAALAIVKDASEILSILLKGGHSVIAGRLAGAFKNIGKNDIADEIVRTMESLDYKISIINPFEKELVAVSFGDTLSPHVCRMQLMWEVYREQIIDCFPNKLKKIDDIKKYIQQLDEQYVNDAYHSLSIEGYQVTEVLINKVRKGDWNPDDNEKDRDQTNALAARGYWDAFKEVRKSIKKVLKGANPGEVASNDHRDWYRELFAVSVRAGILKAEDLSGYRNALVYIRQSLHVPPSSVAVRELMPAFFELLINEENSNVRIVLGHYFFVYIHPYMDGNGRLGRFLMNLMMASSGAPWLVIPVEHRKNYMNALESVTKEKNIKEFACFIKQLQQS